MKNTLDLANKISPNIVGCKYTDTDLVDLGLCANSGYNILVGGDPILLSALSAGCDGTIGSSYNFHGNLYN